VKRINFLRTAIIVPCCILLLNLVNTIISYKSQLIHDGILRTLFIMGLVLFGGSVVSMVAAPAIESLVNSLHFSSKRKWGNTGELIFITCLILGVFWLYYRAYIMGPGYILPPGWRNGAH
jgi:hypothetical protein